MNKINHKINIKFLILCMLMLFTTTKAMAIIDDAIVIGEIATGEALLSASNADAHTILTLCIPKPKDIATALICAEVYPKYISELTTMNQSMLVPMAGGVPTKTLFSIYEDCGFNPCPLDISFVAVPTICQSVPYIVAKSSHVC